MGKKGKNQVLDSFQHSRFKGRLNKFFFVFWEIFFFSSSVLRNRDTNNKKKHRYSGKFFGCYGFKNFFLTSLLCLLMFLGSFFREINFDCSLVIKLLRIRFFFIWIFFFTYKKVQSRHCHRIVESWRCVQRWGKGKFWPV